jgi:hypothetical protein
VRKSKETIVFAFLVVLQLAGGLRAVGQESLLRITSPVTDEVVMEGKPLRITVAADASVRVLGVLGWNPLPEAHLVLPISLKCSFPKPFRPEDMN